MSASASLAAASADAATAKRSCVSFAGIDGTALLENATPKWERRSQSWHSGTVRREIVPPLMPRAQSYAVSEGGDFSSNSRAFGGIENFPRPTPPTQEQLTNLQMWSMTFQFMHDQKPEVIAFVNSRSGGQTGTMLMQALSDCIGTEGNDGDRAFNGTVCDLSVPNEPEATIATLAEDFRKLTCMGARLPMKRLLICGGDGTVTWILTALEQCKALQDNLHLLPVAIVPLGTGNDLSRSLGWGSGMRRVSDILTYLQWVVKADPVKLDQWRVVVRPHNRLPRGHKLYEPGSHPQLVVDQGLARQLCGDIESALDVEESEVDRHEEVFLGFWQNYFSIGMDARVAGHVDAARSKTATGQCCFRNGFGKACYVCQGFLHGLSRKNLAATLGGSMMVHPARTENCGGNGIARETSSPPQCLPEEAEAPSSPSLVSERSQSKSGDFGTHSPSEELELSPLSILTRLSQLSIVNINSYGAGSMNMFHEKIAPAPCPSDGVVEVMGFLNMFNVIGVLALISRPLYIASARRVAFRLAAGEWMQVDGEPWQFDVGCDVLVEPHRKVNVLCAPASAPFWCGRPKPSFWS
eukprot:TRINITY_DN15483_c0_g1_i1.p1 TRINITY_DN15483_c0_g1~~TRINITY_DN15483_c0_g1_i1.p1  ORF type:complete len:616 (+),score=80.82 TRINITY_DN15483_c0_g1_i1:106-1848(+)